MTKDLEHALELLKRSNAVLQRHKHFDAFIKYWPQIELVMGRLTDVEEGLEQVILNIKEGQSKVTR